MDRRRLRVTRERVTEDEFTSNECARLYELPPNEKKWLSQWDRAMEQAVRRILMELHPGIPWSRESNVWQQPACSPFQEAPLLSDTHAVPRRPNAGSGFKR